MTKSRGYGRGCGLSAARVPFRLLPPESGPDIVVVVRVTGALRRHRRIGERGTAISNEPPPADWIESQWSENQEGDEQKRQAGGPAAHEQQDVAGHDLITPGLVEPVRIHYDEGGRRLDVACTLRQK